MNKTILCVDDEPEVLEAYRQTLQQGPQEDVTLRSRLAARRRRTGGEAEPITTTGTDEPAGPGYTVLTASSGEEAVDIVRRQLNRGQQIAVGFFDMLMPGGIDGQETMARIRELDNQILCAVVTAYTDRSTTQIGSLFERQDDWLYFNKPFTMGELSQTALNLVSSWNRRRNEETLISNLQMMQDGLISILDFVHDLNRIPPLILDLLLEGILGHFLRLARAADGYIRVHDEDQQHLKIIGAGRFKGLDAAAIDTMSEPWSLAEDAIRAQKSIVIDRMAAIPLRIGMLVQGVLFIQQETRLKQDPQLLDMFAVQAVNMIQNSKIYKELHQKNIELTSTINELREASGQLSKSEELRAQYEKLTYYDSLTTLPNRRYLEAWCRELIPRCMKHKVPLACLMIDLDHFKEINDTHGHIFGDQVLRQIGGILAGEKRVHEFAGRYGGEEFTIFLEGISRENALKFGERIRAAVENHAFTLGEVRARVTISVGIAVTIPVTATSMTAIIDLADAALYEAKKNGRNQCILAAND